jgi:hypothetical protein
MRGAMATPTRTLLLVDCDPRTEATLCKICTASASLPQPCSGTRATHRWMSSP